MALPVAVTVAALGAGWLILSKERANLVPQSGASPNPVVRDHVSANPGGHVAPIVQAETESESQPGTVMILQHPEGNADIVQGGVDPTTSSTSQSTALDVGKTSPAADDATTPQYGSDSHMIFQLAFGSSPEQMNGMSKSQQAKAIQDYGAQMGAVW